MPAEPRPFPVFTIVDPAKQLVSISLSTGQNAEFQLSYIKVPTDILPVEHPDFETFYAVFKWLESKSTNLSEGFLNPQIIQEYMNAYYIPMEIST